MKNNLPVLFDIRLYSVGALGFDGISMIVVVSMNCDVLSVWL